MYPDDFEQAYELFMSQEYQTEMDIDDFVLWSNDVNLLNVDFIKRNMYNEYWLIGKCDEMPSGLSLIHFENCAAFGVYSANKFLQNVLGYVRVELQDGFLGPEFFQRLSLASISDVIKSVAVVHKRKLREIATRDNYSQTHLTERQNRIEAIKDAALAIM